MPPKKEQAKQKDAKATAKSAGKEAEPKASSSSKQDAPVEQQGPPPKPRLKDIYRDQVVPALTREFGYTNVMQVPRLEKIVLNMGVGQAGQTGGDAKLLDNAMRDMSIIAGQKPCVTRARKSISNFKIRAGARIGCKVTLRGDRMYEFLDRFVSTALPRVRDFQGISPNCFDGRGNFATGVREQLIFPEIEYDKIDKVRGMDIIICTSARSDEEARSLLKGLGMPFRER